MSEKTEERPFLDMAERIEARVAQKMTRYPCTSNRASELGHPCPRYLTYARKDWDKRPMYGVGTALIFEGGNLLEDAAVRQIQDEGNYEVIGQQQSFEWKQYQVTGHTDGLIRDIKSGSREHYPLEVKHYADWDFQKLFTVKDFLESGKTWLIKTPTQLALYMVMAGKEWGVLWIRSKQSFQGRPIVMSFDEALEFAEPALQRAEKVNEAIVEGIDRYPERIPYDNTWCSACPFVHLCLPDRTEGKDYVNLNEAEAAELIRRYIELGNKVAEIDPEIKELEAIEKSLKKFAGQHLDLYPQGFMVNGKYRICPKGKGRVNVKASDRHVPAYSYWKWQIEEVL